MSIVALTVAAAGVSLVTAARAQEAPAPKLVIGDNDKLQVIRFDDARGTRTATFTIGIEPQPAADSTPVTPFGAVRGDLISEQKRRLEQNDVRVTKIVYNDVDGFDVTVAVTAKNVKPGRYTGVVVLGGRIYAATPVTVATTLRAGIFWSFVVAMIGFVGGVILKALTDLFKAPGEKVRSRTSIAKYFLRSGFIATVAFGLFGAIAAWGFMYLGNDVWGAGDLDDFKLAGTTLAGVVTGTTVADFFAPFKGNPATPSV